MRAGTAPAERSCRCAGRSARQHTPIPSYIFVAAALQTLPAKRSRNVSRPALGWIMQQSIAAALEASIDAAWHQRRQQNKEPHLRDAHLPCKKEERGVCDSFCAPVTIQFFFWLKIDLLSMERGFQGLLPSGSHKHKEACCRHAHALDSDDPLRY